MNAPTAILWSIALVSLASAAYIDLRERILPNRSVLIVLCAAAGLRLVNSVTLAGWSILATSVVSLASYVLASRNWMGWGDAKMIAATSLLVPYDHVVELVFAIAISGGLLSCLYLIARARLKPPIASFPSATPPESFKEVLDLEALRVRAREPMPYALAIALGVAYELAVQVKQCWSGTYCSF